MRETRNGVTLEDRVWALLEDAFIAAGIPLTKMRVIQGSWSKGSKSAGTHAKGGAFDLSIAQLTRAEALALVNELRRRMVCAWMRTPEFGWPTEAGGPHIHGIVADDPGLSWAAMRQVLAYRLHRNGLALGRPDPHPRPNALAFKRPEEVAVKDLHWGATNGSVRALQKALGITQDGYYGPRTDEAVRAHQAASGLSPVDRRGKSFVGPKQAKLLGLGPSVER